MQVARWIVLRVGVLACFFFPAIASGGETVDLSELMVWEENVAAELDGSKVVVLDFFAHWCGPCVVLSRRLHGLEADLNAQGKPINVLPINVEKRNPAATRRFMQQAGMKTAYVDPSGDLVKQFSISSLPFVIVLIPRNEPGEFEVLKTFSGTPEMESVRSLLLSAMASEEPSMDRHEESVLVNAEPIETTFSVSEFSEPKLIPVNTVPEIVVGDEPKANRTEASVTVEAEPMEVEAEPRFNSVEEPSRSVFGIYDSLSAPDIAINNSSITGQFPIGQVEVSVGISRNDSQVDYQPSGLDLVGVAYRRNEAMNQVSLNGSWEFDQRFTGLLSLARYEGFTDYKSVWIDEFYNQQFSLFPNFRDVTPRGHSISLGGRWEYIPGLATFDVVVGYQYDRISPAYEAIPFEPLQVGLIDLDTASLRLVFENVLTPRVRVKQQFQLVDTTARDIRASYFGTANIAVDDDWVLRIDLGATVESPGFDSFQSAVSLEYDIDERWFFHGFFRRYNDSGEIVDPTIISTAAPALDTELFGIGVTWVKDRWSFHVSLGDYDTQYDDVPSSSFQFENLYLDREWDFFRTQLSVTF